MAVGAHDLPIDCCTIASLAQLRINVTLLHLSGIGFILLSAGVLFGSVGHVLFVTSKGKPISGVPLTRYNVIAIAACLIGISLLLL